MVNALSDSDADVRYIAVYTTGELVKVAPDQATTVLPHVAKALKDDSGDVRCAAAVAMKNLVEAVPISAMEALPQLLGVLEE